MDRNRSGHTGGTANSAQAPRILLLNPPGRKTYLRDYYCSKASQADYINHPIDLLLQSGWLSEVGEVHLIDAIVERLPPEKALQRIENLNPGLILGLIGAASYQEDVDFYRRLRPRLAGHLVLSGDVLAEDRSRRMEELEFADAFLHDFACGDLAAWAAGSAGHRLSNLTIREAGRVLETPIRRERSRLSRFPTPVQRLFVGKNYRYPFVRRRRFATVLTDFGCPYPCNFCIMSTLGWKVRPLEGVFSELEELARLKVPEIFFLDQTFGIDRERTRQLLDGMTALPHRFGWVCFSRPDVVDSELLGGMRQAGCHTVILGVESGSLEILESAQKGYRPEQIRNGFSLARDHGLRTVATIILGLPEETRETFEATLSLLREIEPDYLSINVAVPRLGTPLRHRAARLGLADPERLEMDQSGQPISMPTLTLTRSEVESLRQDAVREFYLNLRALQRRCQLLARQGTWQEFAIHLRQGLGLIRNSL